jgi:hypothetical protein
MTTESKRRHLILFAAGILSAALIIAAGCRRESGGPPGPPAPPDLEPFIELARGSDCAETRNRLFLIDGALVFWDRAGACADARYDETLFGETTDDVLCRANDSIAGPMRHCPNPTYADLFDIMIAHLDEPDLGLGPQHSVERLAF